MKWYSYYLNQLNLSCRPVTSNFIFKFSFFIYLGLSQVTCINFKIGNNDPLRASNIEIQEPNSPFILFKNSDADKSWQSNQTGNIIALFTDCSKGADKPLKVSLNQIAKGFDRLEINSQKELFFNNRESLRGSFRGFIDGIKVSMESLIFNKNQCFYHLSYSGVSNQFEKELPQFEIFLREFKAP